MRARIILGMMLSMTGPLTVGAAEPDRLFRDQVAPIFERRCVHCHGESAPKGGMSLATAGGLARGGKNGPVVVPGKPDESLLIDMVSGDPPEMPHKDRPLATDQVASLRRWIEQ